MKKDLRKVIALVLSASMFAGVSMFASATTSDEDFYTGGASKTSDQYFDGIVSGSGEIEGKVDRNVVKVVVPTSASSDFDFALDPQNLAFEAWTNDKTTSKYNTVQEDATMLFVNKKPGAAAGSKNDITNKSNNATITNKGVLPVNVTIEADASKLTAGGMKLVDDVKKFNGKDKNVYIAIGTNATGKDIQTPIAGTDGKVDFKTYTAGVPSNYELKQNSTGYVYTAKSSVDVKSWDSFDFYLTGACDSTADWSDYAAGDHTVNIKWTFAPFDMKVNFASLPTASTTDITKVHVGYANPSEAADITMYDGAATLATDEIVTVYPIDTTKKYITPLPLSGQLAPYVTIVAPTLNSDGSVASGGGGSITIKADGIKALPSTVGYGIYGVATPGSQMHLMKILETKQSGS